MQSYGSAWDCLEPISEKHSNITSVKTVDSGSNYSRNVSAVDLDVPSLSKGEIRTVKKGTFQ
ncbi:hypothetical protein MAR_011201 [Mya arenaria]|uniref:Uncharacterized protein n=1 Tax=Mya arenaria TaxID=6604 RepID=A0ABY7FWR5_MYAAR|nr:hypothetical protein MAR_011201 [Mya arenaria]